MAHFAKINENNIVIEVVVVPDSEEHRGNEYLNSLGLSGTWIQTSITGRIRGAFAEVGARYIPEVDKFMPLAPANYKSFIFDETKWKWVPPIDIPTDADWAVGFSETPELKLELVACDSCPSGKIEAYVPVLESGAKVYFWDEELVSWRIAAKRPASE